MSPALTNSYNLMFKLLPRIIYHARMPHFTDPTALEDATPTTVASRPRHRARYTLEARWPHRAVPTSASHSQPDLSAIDMAIAELSARAKVTPT